MFRKSFYPLVLALLIAAGFGKLHSQTTYQINVESTGMDLKQNHLDLGGENPSGERISVNNYFIEKSGEPFFPIIGEFHFSRFNEEYWEEELLKMKAGGINVIATYVFWNIHERQEGQFDWTGDLNLGKFLELIKKHDLFAIVRMGPFCHGEMRNGGLPDWLYGRTFEVRSNDPEYLEYVNAWYGQIAEQINDYLYKEGGPVVGVQLENEYQHSAAPWEYTYPQSRNELTVADLDAALANIQIAATEGINPRAAYGKEHMKNLKEIAVNHGIEVPIYTATGWGNATIVEKGSVPVTAGYAYPFWAEPSASPFYLFKDIRKNPDYSPVSYDTDLYPSIPGEIGPGIQVKFSRRPFVPYESVNPLMVRIIGSGSNGMGYYMYHGGSTPQFDGKFYNEAVSGIPRINYDFQAPLGQYGQVRYHFKHLRMIHMFLDAYAKDLASMTTTLPENNGVIKPQNTEDLRYAVRASEDSGFLFMINFQDHVQVETIEDVAVEVNHKSGSTRFPHSGTFDVEKATSAILPFGLKTGTVTLTSATVQPLTVLNNDDTHYVFSTLKGISAELNFPKSTKISALKNARVVVENELISVQLRAAGPASFTADDNHFLILPHDMAINASKIGESLYITETLLLEDISDLKLITQKTENMISVFPNTSLDIWAENAKLQKQKAIFNGFDTYMLSFEEVKPEVEFSKVSTKKYTLKLNSDISNLNDVFVNIDYVGDRGLAFIDGQLINDHFYHGRKWEMSLKHFAPLMEGEDMVFVFQPMHDDYDYLKDLPSVPTFEKGSYLKVNGVEIVPEYKISLKTDK